MRRNVVAYVTAAGLGAAFWAVAMLMPYAPQAQAQALLHLHSEAAKPSVAATIRDRILEEGSLRREFECLALNVYWEARGEPLNGKYAVAAVTLNRVANARFPDSICQVVRQGIRLGYHRCQFSWACDRYGDRPRDRVAWKLANDVAYGTLFLDQPDPTGGALYFHATRVRPSWSRTMVKVGRIGKHIYYRQAAKRKAYDLNS